MTLGHKNNHTDTDSNRGKSIPFFKKQKKIRCLKKDAHYRGKCHYYPQFLKGEHAFE